jgi:hypothetical protein
MSSLSSYVSTPTTNPGESLRSTIASDVHDYSVLERDSWIYGIIVGWDSATLKHQAVLHHWNEEEVARLNRLHAAFTHAFSGGGKADAGLSRIHSDLRLLHDALQQPPGSVT